MLWSKILKLSHDMYAHAKKEEWEEVFKLEPERKQAIKEFFTHAKNQSTIDQRLLKKDIENILAMDQKIMVDVEKNMAQIMQESHGVQRSHRAVVQYEMNRYRNI